MGSDRLLVAADGWIPGNVTDPDYVAPLGEGVQQAGSPVNCLF